MNMPDMGKQIKVACAIIEHDGQILAAQRSATMSLPLKWEFPGGKIEPGESPRVCLLREVREELTVDIRILTALPHSTHHYPDFTVTLYPFRCVIAGGEIVLQEHCAIRWLPPFEMLDLDWAEADLPVIEDYLLRLR